MGKLYYHNYREVRMKIDGKQVDMIAWLRDTGGANAVKRFSTQKPLEQPAPEKNALGKDDAANLKIQMQYNKAGMASGVTQNTISSYLSQLQALNTTPFPPQKTAQDTNTVQFNNLKANNAVVTGSFNSVDFRSQAAQANNNAVTVKGKSNIVVGYNGGQQNNLMTITGDSNRLNAGEGVSNSALTINGSKNTVKLAAQASSNTVFVTGSNVKVSIGAQGATAGSNQNWNINVAASNVEVKVENGKATVNVADDLKDKYKVTIDTTAKTVSITAV
jgi:hypothetical protein